MRKPSFKSLLKNMLPKVKHIEVFCKGKFVGSCSEFYLNFLQPERKLITSKDGLVFMDKGKVRFFVPTNQTYKINSNNSISVRDNFSEVELFFRTSSFIDPKDFYFV